MSVEDSAEHVAAPRSTGAAAVTRSGSSTAAERAGLLNELRMAVAVARLIQSGDQMLGLGVTPQWERAHAASCDVLDRCEAAGIPVVDLDAVIAASA